MNQNLPTVDFGIGALSLTKLHFSYENTVTRERYSADLGTSTLLAEKIDLPSHRIALKKFLLENTNVVIAQSKLVREQNRKVRCRCLTLGYQSRSVDSRKQQRSI
jgi:hypothetical protein